ncbi:hypothetical protein D3C85_1574580 [compost metagenome]
MPADLKINGTLKGSEADLFKDKADDFIGSLGSKVTSKISLYIKSIEQGVPPTISGCFIKEIEVRINDLKKQVDNAAQTIDRLERLVRKAGEVSL